MRVAHHFLTSAQWEFFFFYNIFILPRHFVACLLVRRVASHSQWAVCSVAKVRKGRYHTDDRGGSRSMHFRSILRAIVGHLSLLVITWTPNSLCLDARERIYLPTGGASHVQGKLSLKVRLPCLCKNLLRGDVCMCACRDGASRLASWL